MFNLTHNQGNINEHKSKIIFTIHKASQNVKLSPLWHSFLENPLDRGAWWAAVHEVTKSWTRLSNFTFQFHALEKEMATHSSVLAWRIPGMGEPGGLPSMGSHRVGHDWSNLAAAAACIWPIREGHLIWNHIKVVCICGFKLPCFATLTFSKGYICICSKVPLKVLLCTHAKSL